MKSFKTVLCVGILTAASVPLLAQQPRHKRPRFYREPLTQDERTDYQHQAQSFYGMMKAPDWGKRSDHDQYIILFRLISDYATLDSTGTARAQEAQGLWNKLLAKEPQWRDNPPQDRTFKEQRDLIRKQQAKAQAIAEKAKTWRPDASNYQMSFFQGRGRKPFKTITFGYPISWTGGSSCLSWFLFHHKNLKPKIYAVGTDVAGYQPQTWNEHAMMNHLETEGKDLRHLWLYPNASYKEFYGVISTGGKILSQIPFLTHFPNKVLMPIWADPNGSFAAFLIGGMTKDNDDEPGTWFFNYGSATGVIIWTPKKGLRTISIDQAKKEFPILVKWRCLPE